MRGTSRASLVAVEGRFEPVLTDAGTAAATLGEELFAFVDALDRSGSLRRTLADPSIPGDAKAGLAERLLAHADERTVAVAQDLVRQRWSADDDLGDAAEQLGLDALLTAAESAGTLERVEVELFGLTRALVGQREVRRTLADPQIPGPARAGLVEAILAGRADPITAVVACRAAAAPRGRRFVATLGYVGDLIAERRHRSVATVTAATPLTAVQRARLADILVRAYGREVQLNEVHDPNVLGGLRIQIGPNVVDATVLSRLADARRQLAS